VRVVLVKDNDLRNEIGVNETPIPRKGETVWYGNMVYTVKGVSYDYDREVVVVLIK
jgi:hypothetical protein